MLSEIQEIFKEEIILNQNLITLSGNDLKIEPGQVEEVFSDKWKSIDTDKNLSKKEIFQRNWYLKLYGFDCEEELQNFLQNKRIILDAGCGLGNKSAWFADLAPESIIIGMDISESIEIASELFKDRLNLFFIRNSIAESGIKSSKVNYVNCDQVIHHTEEPTKTLKHLSSLLSKEGELAVYVYAKKALPRELLDEYFRGQSKKMSKDELWQLSDQLTQLGKSLSEIDRKIDVPNIPALGIKGGNYDLQRFIYWNFIKCFWNEELEYDLSKATNFDWYSPSKAYRYTEQEFNEMLVENNLEHVVFHSEEACFSGRFKKRK